MKFNNGKEDVGMIQRKSFTYLCALFYLYFNCVILHVNANNNDAVDGDTLIKSIDSLNSKLEAYSFRKLDRQQISPDLIEEVTAHLERVVKWYNVESVAQGICSPTYGVTSKGFNHNLYDGRICKMMGYVGDLKIDDSAKLLCHLLIWYPGESLGIKSETYFGYPAIIALGKFGGGDIQIVLDYLRSNNERGNREEVKLIKENVAAYLYYIFRDDAEAQMKKLASEESNLKVREWLITDAINGLKYYQYDLKSYEIGQNNE